MSKYNITFKGKNYSIDKSLLSSTIASLEATLSDLSAGNGSDAPVALAAGLYETGSNYTIMKMSWDELVDGGAIEVIEDTDSDGASGYILTGGNPDLLAGELVLHPDIFVISTTALAGFNEITKVHFPARMQIILGEAFACCTSLKAITFDENCRLIWIQETAFSMCPALAVVNIPIFVEDCNGMGDCVFDGCTALETVNFAGTVEQWNYLMEMSSEDWCLWGMPATYVQCSDGQVAL